MAEDPGVNDAYFLRQGAKAFAEKIGSRGDFPRVMVSQIDKETGRTVLDERAGLVVPIPEVNEGSEIDSTQPPIDMQVLLEPDGALSIIKPNGVSGAVKAYPVDTSVRQTEDYARIHGALGTATQAYLDRLNGDDTPPPEDPQPDGGGSAPVRLYTHDDTVAA